MAIRLESLVESDVSLRSKSVESQSQEDLRRHPLVHKPRHVLEAKSPVVIRMPHETATLSIQVFQACQPFLYGASGFRVGNSIRIKVELTKMEVDCYSESITISEATRHLFHLLDLCIERFTKGIGYLEHYGIQDTQ